MLRITHEEELGGRAVLRLEGSVGAEWAALLEQECSALLSAGTAVSLDLTGVGLVDGIGIDALRRLSHAGVEVRCHFGAVASVLEADGVRVTLVPGSKW